ncbi:prepilin-type N-terminal cleavage/methylation domain-containing protein [Elusimicrobiota bacterium]
MFLGNKERGFTLAEVLIALIIFTSVSLISIAYVGFGKKQDVNAKRQVYGLKLAEDQIEMYKTMSYDSIADQPSTIHSKYGTDFTRSYSASELQTTSDKYKVVSVTITWNASSGPQKVNLFTIVSP